MNETTQKTSGTMRLFRSSLSPLSPVLYIIMCLLLAGPDGAGAQESAPAATTSMLASIYNPGTLRATDSVLKVKVGDVAPDFELPAIDGKRVRLSSYRNRSNVVLSFVPAAWTPVCSDQWPGYNITKNYFDEYDAELIGITVDNIPTLHAWVTQMGALWFPVLSDFWPHGKVADSYGVLRSDGTAERALFFIDRQGIIRAIEVSDINLRPSLELVVGHLQALP